MGWIFFKPKYEKLDDIDKDDLNDDPVVTFQHNYYVPIALSLGFVMPLFLGYLWDDAVGAFIWGGLVSRLAIWHCTFCVNSLAHWEGLQPYSDENTSRGNLFLALVTCGEGNHNFHHAFPHDFRSGPSKFDWDPSKWIIFALHNLGLAYGLKRAREKDIQIALKWMSSKHVYGADASATSSAESSVESATATSDEGEESDEGSGRQRLRTDALPVWGEPEVEEYVGEGEGERCVVVINGKLVDVSGYLLEHPGGAAVLRKYSYSPGRSNDSWKKATWAFSGGMNKHSRAATRRMDEMVVARLAGSQ